MNRRRSAYSPPMHSKELHQQIAKATSENQLVKDITQVAHLSGWLLAHFRPVLIERKNGSKYYATPVAIDGEGFPDLCMVNARQRRVVFIETKSQSGVVEPAQKVWLDALEATGEVECGVWRPSDWLSGDIERLLR